MKSGRIVFYDLLSRNNFLSEHFSFPDMPKGTVPVLNGRYRIGVSGVIELSDRNDEGFIAEFNTRELVPA